ncbi:hypothetical protein EYV94_22955 [Puteibacter caeruleilacunae]|nr:hypothetical protein EYV94_22955 [Puteibacter caeruleilacunae]
MLQENKMNKKNRIFLTWVIGAMLATIGFPIWFEYMGMSAEEYRAGLVNQYRTRKYSGVIVDKFISDNNNLRTIIVQTNNRKVENVYGYEVRKVYDFLMVGDTVKKEEGSFFINVSRCDLDTIIEVQFLDSRGIPIPFKEPDNNQKHSSN